MSFICPFKNTECKESCEFWVSNQSENMLGFIPFSFSMEDIIQNIIEKSLKNNNKFAPLIILLKKYGNFGNLNSNIKTNGSCSKLQNIG